MKLFRNELNDLRLQNDGYLFLQQRQVNFLRSVGLSDDEIELYDLMLHKNRPMTAQDVASLAAVYPSALYRLFYDLEDNNLVHLTKHRPKQFRAYLPEQVFEQLMKKKVESIRSFLSGPVLGKSHISSAEVIVGREQLYDRYISEVVAACSSIHAFSIGIAYSKEMSNAHKNAIKRGVVIRYVFQQYKAENFPVLLEWQKLGIVLRHRTSARGFHLMLFDQRRVIISFSDQDNTEDRISIVTDNANAVRIFSSYFEQLWIVSEPISLGNTLNS